MYSVNMVKSSQGMINLLTGIVKASAVSQRRSHDDLLHNTSKMLRVWKWTTMPTRGFAGEMMSTGLHAGQKRLSSTEHVAAV